MLKEQYQELIHNSSESIINSLGDKFYSDDNFDMLYDMFVKTHQWYYGLFFPISSDVSSKEFLYFCLNWHNINHALVDDGEMSLVYYSIKTQYKTILSDIMVCYGFYSNLKKQILEKHIFVHHNKETSKFHSFYAINFNSDVLKFLHSQISTYEQIAKLGTTSDIEQGQIYFDQMTEFKLNILKYIQNHNHFHSKV